MAQSTLTVLGETKFYEGPLAFSAENDLALILWVIRLADAAEICKRISGSLP
jgi:hypothetical protein